VTRRLPENNTSTPQEAAIGVFAVLVGALQFARAVDDRAMSDDILAGGIRAAARLAGLVEEE
jgi:TetR/AcrR family transcriptional regulator, transcriptional repressor for nem operon